MGYVENNLISDEYVTYRARLHWIVMLWPTIVAAILAFGGVIMLVSTVAVRNQQDVSSGAIAGVSILVFALGAVVFLLGWLRRASSEFAVTNKRVIFKIGVLRKRTAEMFLNKIESIGADQGIAGRVFGYGTIVVRGTGGTLEPFDKISHPLEFRRQVQEQIGRFSERAAAPAN